MEMTENKVYAIRRNWRRILNHYGLIKAKLPLLENVQAAETENGIKKLNQVGLVELHLTDACNLNCFYCTYSKKKPDIFPYPALDKIVELNPKAIVLAGGGEPTLYNSEGKKLADAVNYLSENIKGVQMGILTNGIILAEGDWQEHIRWLRISIDASTPETFKKLKGVKTVNKPFDSLIDYLNGPIPFVLTGFLFMKQNIYESADFIKRTYDFLLQNGGKKLIERFSGIEFRPAYPDPLSNDNSLVVSKDDIEKVKKEIDSFSKELKEFAETKTNYREIFKGNSRIEPHDFSKCFVSLAYKLIRADGSIYPCFVLAGNRKYVMGNILDSPPMDIAKNQGKFYNCCTEYCCGKNCRVNYKNEIFETAIKTNEFKKDVPKDDYFF